MERLLNYCLNPPTVAMEWGSGLFKLGGFFLFSGLYGSIATTAAKKPLLSEMYPGWPLWFVPESALAFVAVGLLMLAGLVLHRLGAKFSKWRG